MRVAFRAFVIFLAPGFRRGVQDHGSRAQRLCLGGAASQTDGGHRRRSAVVDWGQTRRDPSFQKVRTDMLIGGRGRGNK